MIRVLIADDERSFRKVLLLELGQEGIAAEEAGSGKEALERMGKEEYDIVLLDLYMPGLGGLEILKQVQEMDDPPEVIILTAHGTVSAAVEAMKLGAYDFISKPFQVAELAAMIEKAHEKKGLRRQNRLLRVQIERQTEPYRIVTRSPRFLSLLESLRKFAPSDLPVLISGESGVGKELVARFMHGESPRGKGPFVPLNCGAIPENMMESEIFGHERGAFTGAHERKPGLLEVAHGGALFLDEISELAPGLQTKLLRVIETKTFFRVGGTREIKVDARFLAATNRDLKEEAAKGHFRPDLFFRVSALAVDIPPLRERKEDIAPLVEHTIRANPGFRKKRFSPGALRALEGYPWPGNVRELQNVVHRTLLLAETEMVEPEDLPPDLLNHREPAGQRLKDVEREHILRVLKGTGGKRAVAAEILGLDPKTLYRKLLAYGVREESGP